MITPLPAGSTFAGYQVDAVLARGGMGVVYLATELRPRRRVALKLIAPALAADPAYRERFLREVDNLAALEHPNVVPIHAAGEWDGQLYLAMRYLDGPDLAEVVRTRGPLPRPRPSPSWRPSPTRSTSPTRGDRPPRRHAGQHPPRRAGHPVPHRLRPHQAGRPRWQKRPDPGPDGDAVLHGARAVRGADGRRAGEYRGAGGRGGSG